LLADEYDAYANEYMNPHDLWGWSKTELFLVQEAFWCNIKAGMKWSHGIKKEYITGVTPLVLSTGTNDHYHVSFSRGFSTICGLTRSDILEALRIICSNEEEVQKHLRILAYHANGFHFCQHQMVEPVFNTQTALSYLQVSK
jgi:hypothetical protein